MNIFIYADMKSKITRCRMKNENEKFTDKELEKNIIQIDKNRKKYHNLISNIEWGKKENYHLCINTSNMEIKTMIKPIKEYIENWFKESDTK